MLLAVLAALAVIALRLILFYTGHPPEGTDFMIVHFLAITTVVFFAGHSAMKADREAGFPTLVREGFKGAAIYALLLMAFVWYYYTNIQDTYFAERVERMVAKGLAEGQSEGLIRPRLMKFFTPFNYASMTFFGLLITGIFNALLIGVLHHKVLRRFRR